MASGYRSRPSAAHHRARFTAANAGVSWEVPTKTAPAIRVHVVDPVRSRHPDGIGAEVVVVDEDRGPVQAVPAFLKLPTSSFFLESMLTTGRCRSAKPSGAPRCGRTARCDPGGSPATLLRLTRREKSRSSRNRATVLGRPRCPGPQLLRDLQGRAARPLEAGAWVTGDVVLHQLLDSRDDLRRFFSTGFRPAPFLRTRSPSTSFDRSCCRPLATVPGSRPSRSAILRSPP